MMDFMRFHIGVCIIREYYCVCLVTQYVLYELEECFNLSSSLHHVLDLDSRYVMIT